MKASGASRLPARLLLVAGIASLLLFGIAYFAAGAGGKSAESAGPVREVRAGAPERAALPALRSIGSIPALPERRRKVRARRPSSSRASGAVVSAPATTQQPVARQPVVLQPVAPAPAAPRPPAAKPKPKAKAPTCVGTLC
jgi:hypothetical protein